MWWRCTCTSSIVAMHTMGPAVAEAQCVDRQSRRTVRTFIARRFNRDRAVRRVYMLFVINNLICMNGACTSKRNWQRASEISVDNKCSPSASVMWRARMRAHVNFYVILSKWWVNASIRFSFAELRAFFIANRSRYSANDTHKLCTHTHL